MSNGDGVLEKQAGMAFGSAIQMRYEDWKNGNLLEIAIQTMPKQVNPEKVIDNLIRLKSEFGKRFDDVSDEPIQTQNDERTLAIVPRPVSAIVKPRTPAGIDDESAVKQAILDFYCNHARAMCQHSTSSFR